VWVVVHASLSCKASRSVLMCFLAAPYHAWYAGVGLAVYLCLHWLALVAAAV
jgi:hypothetical protein